MRYEKLSNNLDEIALHYRLQGMGHIARQYEKASTAVGAASFIPPNPCDLDNVGESIRDDIAEYRAFGEIPRLEEMREERPYLSELTSISSVGPKTAKTLYDESGSETIKDIKDLIEREELTDVSGIGPKTAETIRRSVAQMNQ